MKNILKSKNNKLYLLSVITDNLGSSLMSFALPIMVLDITKNGIHLSIISIIETLPILILGLPAGAFFRVVFVLSQNVPTMVLAIAFVSIIESIINISIITNRQQQVEPRYLGRVTSIYKTVLIGVNSFGFLLGGLVAKKIGSRSGIGVSAIALLLVTVISIYLLAPKIKQDNKP